VHDVKCIEAQAGVAALQVASNQGIPRARLVAPKVGTAGNPVGIVVHCSISFVFDNNCPIID